MLFQFWMVVVQGQKKNQGNSRVQKATYRIKMSVYKLQDNPDSPFSYEKQITLLIRNKSCETSSILTFSIPTIQY